MECVSEDARSWRVENEADALPHEVVAVNEAIKEFCSECGEVKRVGNYFVGGQELGEGMFAKVKKGIHALTGESVAIKITDKKHKSVNEYILTHLHREARLLKRLRHPNIVQAFEVMETDSKFYLVQELCPKGDLMRYVEHGGPLSEKETRKYMRQLVSAIDYLHQASILHRDLKLENILFDANKNIKLIDFGLSNDFGGETVCGSPAYSSPEVLGAKHYGPEADIWSLGVNMFAMLTGTLPYSVNGNAKNVVTLLHVKMLERKMNPIPSHVSEECKDLLLKLLEFDPAKRIKMNDILIHPWLCPNPATPLTRCIFPNQLADSDLNDDILAHMLKFMQNECKSSLSELIFALLNQELSADAAVYHLLEKKLHRYEDIRSKELMALNRRRKKSSSETDIITVLDKLNHDHMSMRRTSSLSKKTKSLKALNERNLKRMQSERTLPLACTPAATPQVAKVRTRHTTEPIEPASDKLGLPMLSPKSPAEKQTFQDLPPITTANDDKVPLPTMHHRTTATAYSKDRRDCLLQWVNKPSATVTDRVKRNRSFRVAMSDTIEHAYHTLPPERQPSVENLSMMTESTIATFESPSMLSIHSVESDALDCSRQQHNFLAASPPFIPSQPPPLNSMYRTRTNNTVHGTRLCISDQPLPSINQRTSSLPRNPKLKKWHSERIKRKH